MEVPDAAGKAEEAGAAEEAGTVEEMVAKDVAARAVRAACMMAGVAEDDPTSTAAPSSPVVPPAGTAAASEAKAGAATASAGGATAGKSGGGSRKKELSHRMRKRFEKPPPFVPDGAAGLLAELKRSGIDEAAACGELQALSEVMRVRLELPLATPIVAGSSEEANEDLFVGLGATRETRRVNVLLRLPAEMGGEEKAGAPPPPPPPPNSEDGGAGPVPSSSSAGRPSSAAAGAAEAPARRIVSIDLTLPKKANFPSDSDSEAEIETVESSRKAAAQVKDGAADEEDEGGKEDKEGEGGISEEAKDAAAAEAARAAAAEAAREAEIALVHSWQPALQEAVDLFDKAIDTRRLRGMSIVIGLPAGAASPGAPCPASIRALLALLLGSRNCVSSAPPLAKLLKALAAPSAAPASLLWDGRWSQVGGKRSRPSYAPAADSDEEDEEDEEEDAGSKFLPFGQVVGASGCSIRATVACSAGLAAEMPLWGLSLRGDQAWLVRALKPTNVVVLREGERSLIQATLVDADGRGVPSAERLMKAVLLATPAIPYEITKAVDVQRDGAVNDAQQGRARPLVLQKRELNRFLDGIKEYESMQRQKAVS